MNDGPSTELSSDEQETAEKQAVIYAVISEELFFLYRDEVERINEVQGLFAGSGTYSALIKAMLPLDYRIAELLQGFLEDEEAELEGEDREAASETLRVDYAELYSRLYDLLQDWGQMLFDVGNAGLPAEIESAFGRLVVGDSPVWSGEYLSYPAAEEAAIVQSLRDRGVSVTRDDSAVMSCLEG